VAFLAVASELFTADDVVIVERMMADYFACEHHHGHACAVDSDDTTEQPLAVTYWEPAKATDRSWCLTVLAVRRDRHRQGRGRALLQHNRHPQVRDQLAGPRC
jgi:GNAT superfamily N-acetyltransferase